MIGEHGKRPYRRVSPQALEEIRQWRAKYAEIETIKQIARRLDLSKSAIESAVRTLNRAVEDAQVKPQTDSATNGDSP